MAEHSYRHEMEIDPEGRYYRPVFNETDGHILGILRGNWCSWEVIRAEALGRKRVLQFGPGTLHSGDNVLAAKIQSMGLQVSEAQKEAITAALRQAIQERGFASEEEVVEGLIQRELGR